MNGYETDELVKDHIAALLREREGHEAVGNTAGVKACDEQLRAFGHGAKKPAARAERRRSPRRRKPAAAKAEPKTKTPPVPAPPTPSTRKPSPSKG